MNAAANYYFMAASTFFIAGAGTWVTEKIVQPRLGNYVGEVDVDEGMTTLTQEERRGLKYALAASDHVRAVLDLGDAPDDVGAHPRRRIPSQSRDRRSAPLALS